MTDARLTRNADPEIRGDRNIDPIRDDKHINVSDDDFEELLRGGFNDARLPNPPKMEGWHLCWLTTQSSSDPLHKRLRLGYIPVRSSEMPEFDPSNGQKLSGHEDFVTCNEMILCKFPMDRYQRYMQMFHHQKPLEDEEGVVAQAKRNDEDSSGRRLQEEEGDGISDMERQIRDAKRNRPVFS